MSKRTNTFPDLIPNVGFNVKAQEQFAQDHGITFEHWAAIPSPIGLRERGDYRRSETLDTISENGFIYKKVGEFTGIVVNNHKSNYKSEGGIFDNATARLVLPKFYNARNPSKAKEISLLPGDRIYAKQLELNVSNYQRAEYGVTHNDFLQFPAKTVDHLIDSRGIEYKCGVDFLIDAEGSIQWIPGKNNPGIDKTTGKGRVYAVRYTYLAFWYISQLLNEIRVTNNEAGSPVRLPYQALIQREYVYHNRVRSETKAITTEEQSPVSRTNEQPDSKTDANRYEIQVDASKFEE